MAHNAVVKTGGKQFLVKVGDMLVVDHIVAEVGALVELPILATFAADGSEIELGKPQLSKMAVATVIEQGKGEKIRVAKFKSKVRYRNVTGFRATLTKLQIKSI